MSFWARGLPGTGLPRWFTSWRWDRSSCRGYGLWWPIVPGRNITVTCTTLPLPSWSGDGQYGRALDATRGDDPSGGRGLARVLRPDGGPLRVYPRPVSRAVYRAE